MSQSLTLQLKESTFSTIQQQAENQGISPELLSVNLLEQQIEKTIKENLDNTQQESAKQKFSRHFGKLNLDYITPVDNDSIDTDLAKGYMANGEDI